MRPHFVPIALLATVALAGCASAPPPPPAHLAPPPPPAPAPSAPAIAKAPPPPPPASLLVVNVAAARPPLHDFLFCIPTWTPFRREARLHLAKGVDWLVEQFTADATEDVSLVRYREPDLEMDDVMEAEGAPLDVPGVAHAWHPRHLEKDAVFFRSTPSVLGLTHRSRLDDPKLDALMADANPAERPPIFLDLRDPAHLPQGLPFAIREIKLTVVSLDNGRTRAEADVEIDEGTPAADAVRILREQLPKGREVHAPPFLLERLEIRADEGHVHASLEGDDKELAELVRWLRARP
ncbi:MAG TPA: hypothetical protein VGI39_36940 [Polyangiaceae bacterium]